MFKVIGLILLLVAMKMLFSDVFDAAETFLREFFEFGTAVLHDSAGQANIGEYP